MAKKIQGGLFYCHGYTHVHVIMGRERPTFFIITNKLELLPEMQVNGYFLYGFVGKT